MTFKFNILIDYNTQINETYGSFLKCNCQLQSFANCQGNF